MMPILHRCHLFKAPVAVEKPSDKEIGKAAGAWRTNLDHAATPYEGFDAGVAWLWDLHHPKPPDLELDPCEVAFWAMADRQQGLGGMSNQEALGIWRAAWKAAKRGTAEGS